MNLSPKAASHLADMVLYLHFGIVLFVLLGFLFIIAGMLFKWRWTKERSFRYLHLVLIILVALQAIFDKLCSLTLLEHNLRIAAGEAGYEAGFIAHFIGRLIYYNLPSWLFTLVYVGAAIMALLLFKLWPPSSRLGSDR